MGPYSEAGRQRAMMEQAHTTATMLRHSAAIAVQTEGQANKQRESEIELMARRLERAVNSLHEVIDVLCGRMQPVVRNEPPSPASIEKADAEAATPVGESLRQRAQGIENATSRIYGLLDRLEL